jgi:hypothetical protein
VASAQAEDHAGHGVGSRGDREQGGQERVAVLVAGARQRARDNVQVVVEQRGVFLAAEMRVRARHGDRKRRWFVEDVREDRIARAVEGSIEGVFEELFVLFGGTGVGCSRARRLAGGFALARRPSTRDIQASAVTAARPGLVAFLLPMMVTTTTSREPGWTNLFLHGRHPLRDRDALGLR